MFLKNKNIVFKIRRSKVTDYAALIKQSRSEVPFYTFLTYFDIDLIKIFLCDIHYMICTFYL